MLLLLIADDENCTEIVRAFEKG